MALTVDNPLLNLQFDIGRMEKVRRHEKEAFEKRERKYGFKIG